MKSTFFKKSMILLSNLQLETVIECFKIPSHPVECIDTIRSSLVTLFVPEVKLGLSVVQRFQDPRRNAMKEHEIAFLKL